MRAPEARRAVAAAMRTARGSGLVVDGAVVLNDSNRLVVHLTPCGTIARVTPLDHHPGHHASTAREVEVVEQLERIGGPVAPLEPRVASGPVERDGFEITMWTYLEPVQSPLRLADYGDALLELHDGLRQVDVEAPHVIDRVAATRRDVDDRGVTPDLEDADRTLLADTLRVLERSITHRRADEQVLHGEPHPWNVLVADDGPRFIDFENTARGPVEYDLAWAPRAVGDRYGDADQDLVDECRGIVLAIVAAHRWRHDDDHPSGRPSGIAFLDVLRAGPPWPALDEVTW